MEISREYNKSVIVHHLHRELEQDPAAPGFWDMWVDIMRRYWFKPGDYCVTSEPYGQTMADKLDGIFVPYDPQRELYFTKAERIRYDLAENFHTIMRPFQKHLRKTVTFFGAESTGKTTLSKDVAKYNNSHWLFEYARPYLETVGPEINVKSMEAIWRGQLALQKSAQYMYDKPWVVQDTDLFSTVGYWAQPHWEADLGPVPEQLIADALATKSDLYIIPQSNIAFEEDPIRYGGDHRESPDQYWIDLADKYDLNYYVLNSDHRAIRLAESLSAIDYFYEDVQKSIFYERIHNSHGNIEHQR